MDPVIKILTDQGLAIAIVTFMMFFAYRFLNVKLDIMKQQMLKELKNHKFEIEADLKSSENGKNHTVTATIKKVDVKQ